MLNRVRVLSKEYRPIQQPLARSFAQFRDNSQMIEDVYEISVICADDGSPSPSNHSVLWYTCTIAYASLSSVGQQSCDPRNDPLRNANGSWYFRRIPMMSRQAILRHSRNHPTPMKIRCIREDHDGAIFAWLCQRNTLLQKTIISLH